MLLENLVAGLLLLVASRRLRFLSGRGAILLAALPLVNAALLAVFVFGEDSYRGNGISRWDAYRSPGGALGSMFVLSVASMLVCAAALAYAGRGGKEHLARRAALAGGLVAETLVTATIVGFTAN
jgi:hypothetical protein